MAVYMVYVTTRDKAEAVSIGHFLVESRLAACVNIFDGMNSIYYWNGNLQQDDEAVLVAKTVADRLPALIAAVKDRHSYECPCIMSLPVVAGNEDYLAWIAAQVA